MADSQHFSDGENQISSKELCRIEEIKKKSILIKDGNPARYRLKTTTDNLDESKSYRTITFGERDPKKAHKTLLMVGETGTGKSSLINTMINYTCGVKREDKIWIEITDDQSDRSSAQSQTSDVTVYGVYLQEASLDLTIIDTPGYGDTRGISRDKEIAESLLHLCSSDNGLNEIDAVCFVIKANQNRLSESQRYIFDAIQALFGKDVKENIVLLFTHSDGLPPEDALTAVKEAEIKSAVDEENELIYFLFNNCQKKTVTKKYQAILNQSWDLSFRGMAEFFMFLDQISPKSLRMTRDVLKKRKQLEANISNLVSRVHVIEQKQNVLKQTQEALEKNKQEVKDNKNFEYEVEVSYKEKVDIDPDVAYNATCCSVCEENCHYPGCYIAINPYWCYVMSNDHCTVCSKRCHYNKHVKEDKIYVTKTKTEKRTFKDLKKKYEDKIGSGESLVSELKKELQELEKVKIKLVNETYHCVETLKMIALKTDSLFTLQHIDDLIEKLKEIKEPEKAEALEKIKKRAGEEKGTLACFKSLFSFYLNVNKNNTLLKSPAFLDNSMCFKGT